MPHIHAMYIALTLFLLIFDSQQVFWMITSRGQTILFEVTPYFSMLPFRCHPELRLVCVLTQSSVVETVRRVNTSDGMTWQSLAAPSLIGLKELKSHCFAQFDQLFQRQLQLCVLTPQQWT